MGGVLSQVDEREDYGEVRVKAIGEIDGIVLVVIYKDRDDVRWIISARKRTAMNARYGTHDTGSNQGFVPDS